MPPIRSRRSAGIALLLLLPLALAATAAWALTGRTPASPQSSGPEPAPTALRARLPLHGLLHASTDASRRVHQAEQRLVAACMAARGFRYDPAPAAAADSGTSPALFGIETLDRQGGPGTREPMPRERPRDEGFDRALYGDPARTISARNKVLRVTRPATGCLAEAQTRLLGRDGRTRDLTLRLRLDQGERDALRTLEKDPAFRAADSRWRTCMARAGVAAANPRELARGLPRGTNPATHPSVRADLECKERTGYLERAYARLAAMQQRWLDDNQDAVTEWKALRLREDRAARQVLKSATP
ncbi:hypothetical protein [Streptomyces sp. S.PNR 29]|uniref:hypothetical protein n=1 Tax=Streptomyces sp. S.PNR 29 TaxID=2973805 RepID=UPI0025AF42C8|nr:hypothetical protein [Streptomyces sp. S.PNR 29]MDN0199922.1 hypothetical protein [Streptomyces sp. S.PNR 29]